MQTCVARIAIIGWLCSYETKNAQQWSRWANNAF